MPRCEPTNPERPELDAQLRRLRELVRESADIAAAIRDRGPVDVRFEASNLLAGLGDVDELVRDMSIAVAMLPPPREV